MTDLSTSPFASASPSPSSRTLGPPATMSAPTPAPAQASASAAPQTANAGSGPPRPPRRGRGSRGRARGRNGLSFTPTLSGAEAQAQAQAQSQAESQSQSENSTAQKPPSENPDREGGRSRRQRGGNGNGNGNGNSGSRRRGRGGASTTPAPAPAPENTSRRGRGRADLGLGHGRVFQGQLSRRAPTGEDYDETARVTTNGATAHDDLDHDHEGLRGDAPAFVPGAPPPKSDTKSPRGPRGKERVESSKGKAKAKSSAPPPQKVTTKSVAPDIATRIHEDIAHNLYECPICTSELGKRSRVWSCGLCWTVFHLSCVKKWSQNEGAAAQDAERRQGETGEAASPRAWRCPGCNLPQEVFPKVYACWCGKDTDPRPLPGLPPHSCGQTCSRPRKGCPHPCDATCHAGPCAPCTAMGPTQDCFCGRNSSTKRCQDTDYENGWSCGELCGDLLPCGEHTCPRRCHEGLCGACDAKVDARCYCGRVQTDMLCSAKDDEVDSELLRDGDVEEWTGCFACGDECGRPFDCGVHVCQKTCHAQDAEPAHCPRSPDVVSHCPCGKTPLPATLGYVPRTSCEDAIPNCREACGKTLSCGHPCEKICHTGPCGPCSRKVSITCRCGRNSFTVVCHQGSMEPPQCFRVCKAGLHCGRHACTEHCCPGEQKAVERQAMRRKLKGHLRPSEADVEAEHICTRICGRQLKCGRHTCPEICHKGPCNTCREAIFEEIPCNCGRSVLHPPLPCGTQPPPCSFPCERPKPCGHPQTPHNCHTDDERCPKCPFLTEKTCLCGRRALKNQPCWLADARCGQLCGEPLKCGSHFCQKNCHRPGECEDASRPCQQRCGKTKSLCGHPCTEPCHAPYPCAEKTPCTATITVTCPCGRLRQDRRCNAVKAIASKGHLQQSQRGPASTPLSCDDECARLERNRSLASALGVDINPTTTIAPSNLPYSPETLDLYIQLASTSPLSALQSIESTLHSLATSPSSRSIRFQPSKPSLRAFTHALATDWAFATESFDPEPHRHVFVLKPTTWTPPPFGTGSALHIGIGGMSVSECVKLRERQRQKERETHRLAAAEAKAQREAAKAALNASGEGGWAQVASGSGARKGAAGAGGSGSGATTPVRSLTPGGGGTMYAALAGDSAWSGSGSGGGEQKKEKLVLRSGVGVGRQMQKAASASASAAAAPVADSWEEEEEKEEEREGERGTATATAKDGNENDNDHDHDHEKQKTEEEDRNEPAMHDTPDARPDRALEVEAEAGAESDPDLALALRLSLEEAEKAKAMEGREE